MSLKYPTLFHPWEWGDEWGYLPRIMEKKKKTTTTLICDACLTMP
jgi:hypothetical protein